MKLNQLKTKGFTLVEILIVVIIVGLLAGIAVSKLGDSKERAVTAVKKSAAAELNKAIQTAYIKGSVIPAASVQALTEDTAGVLTLIARSEISNQFTASSLAELARNIVDTTPNSGSVVIDLGATPLTATHTALEVQYSTTDYVAP